MGTHLFGSPCIFDNNKSQFSLQTWLMQIFAQTHKTFDYPILFYRHVTRLRCPGQLRHAKRKQNCKLYALILFQ